MMYNNNSSKPAYYFPKGIKKYSIINTIMLSVIRSSHIYEYKNGKVSIISVEILLAPKIIIPYECKTNKKKKKL